MFWMRFKTTLKIERKPRFKMKMLAETCVVELSNSSYFLGLFFAISCFCKLFCAMSCFVGCFELFFLKWSLNEVKP